MNRAPELRLHLEGLIVDCFAGGGGASTGIEMACGRSPDIAINHDPQAVAMHKINHPATKHFCENITQIAPRKVTGGKHVALAWFSPDCTFHSKARGGKPFRDRNKARRIRGLPWVVVNWAREVKPDVIMLENVEEMAHWGPLGADGKPCPLRKGFTFRRWVAMLQNLGYEVDMRELRACDYGAPTTRKRLFIIARRDGKAIVWPEPTHAKGGTRGLLPYRTAAECIDFSLPCPSIFLTKEEGQRVNAKRPLAENTMKRIARGLKKFVLDNPKPFIVPMQRDNRATSLEDPLQTITTQGNKFNLAVPYVAGLAHREHERGAGVRGNAMDDPVRTIHAGGNNHALVTPFITEHANASSPRSFPADEPSRTICANVKGGHFALVAPIAVPRYGEREGQEPRAMTLEAPAPTIVPTQNGQQVVAAFLARHFGRAGTPGNDLFGPVGTLTAHDHTAVVASHVTKFKGTSTGQETDAPLHTIQAQGFHHAEVRAFLTRYNSVSVGQSPSEPLSTIDTTDRVGLVMVNGVPHAIIDIGMRMLKPRELYLCQGFPPGYVIDFTYNGKALPQDAQVRMVGNSVSPVIPAALLRANFAAVLEERVA